MKSPDPCDPQVKCALLAGEGVVHVDVGDYGALGRRVGGHMRQCALNEGNNDGIVGPLLPVREHEDRDDGAVGRVQTQHVAAEGVGPSQ